LTEVIGVFMFYLFSRQVLWREMKGRFFKKWSKTGETRRNTWKCTAYGSNRWYQSV